MELHAGSWGGSAAAVDALLLVGADVHAKGANGKSSLHHHGLERGSWQQLAHRVPTRTAQPYCCLVALIPLSSASDGDTHRQPGADQSVGYSRSPKHPALQKLQKSSKSASTTPQRPIWNSFATVGVWDFWENGCKRSCGLCCATGHTRTVASTRAHEGTSAVVLIVCSHASAFFL